MSNTILRLDNVAVGYKNPRSTISDADSIFWALKDVSMSVGAGETIGIIGRNGAGKSTLLKVLAGIIDPDRGDIARAPGRASLLSLQVGFLQHLSGVENAILSGILLGLSRSEVENKLDDIFDFADINEFAHAPIATYSSGMRARLGFAVAYYSAPEILLIDEVLGVGDAIFREKSSAAIREIIQSDKTVVLVSHQTSLLDSLCQRLVWIEEGISRCEGEPREVIQQYEAYALGNLQQQHKTGPLSA